MKTILILGVSSNGAASLIRVLRKIGKYRIVGTDANPIDLAVADLDRTIEHRGYDFIELLRIVDTEPTYKLFNFDEKWNAILNESAIVFQDVLLPDFRQFFAMQEENKYEMVSDKVYTYTFLPTDEKISFQSSEYGRLIQWPAAKHVEDMALRPDPNNFYFDQLQDIGLSWLEPFIEGQDDFEYAISTHFHTWVYNRNPIHLISPGAKDLEKITKERFVKALEEAGLKGQSSYYGGPLGAENINLA